MNEEKLNLLKDKMNLSEKDIKEIKDGILILYIDSVIKGKPTLTKRYGENIDLNLKKNINEFLNIDEDLIKKLSKEKIEQLSNTGKIIINSIPEKDKKITKNSFKFNKVTRILWFQENLLKRLKQL